MLAFNYDCIELFLVSFVSVIILVILKRLLIWSRFCVIARNIPGIISFPMTSARNTTNSFKKLKKRFGKYGPTFIMWSPLDIYIHFSRAEDVDILLGASENLTKSYLYSHLKAYLGNGLLTSGGAMWNLKRKIMTPSFKLTMLKKYYDILQSRSDVLVKQLEAHCNDENFEISPLLSSLILMSICESMLGINIEEESEIDANYIQCHSQILKIISNRTIRIFPNFMYKMTAKEKLHMKCVKTILQYNKNIIKERRMYRQTYMGNETKKHINLLDSLLEAQENGILINDKEIIDEINTVVFAGNNTTSEIVQFCLFLLGNNQDVQGRVFKEIIEVVGVEDGPITMKHLAEMKYLERVFKETLRLYPPAPIIGRIADEDIKIGEYTVPEGGNILVNIYKLHRDSRYFPDPEKFDPDRFLPNEINKLHKFAYIPFGTGARNCIGEQFGTLLSKLILVKIIKKHNIFSMDKPEEININFNTALQTNTNIKLNIVKR